MTVHSLTALMDMLSRYEPLTEEEREAARVLRGGVEKALPKGRVYAVLHEDADPGLSALEAIASDVSDMNDSLALIEDHLTALKRLRADSGGTHRSPEPAPEVTDSGSHAAEAGG